MRCSRLVVPTLVALLTPLLAGPVAPVAAASSPTCDGKRATIVGTPDDDDLVGTPHADVIAGLGGGDRISGGGGNDTICGDDGFDHLSGGGGNDRLDTGKGIERADGGRGDDVIIIRSYANADIQSEPGNDRITVTRSSTVTFDLTNSPVGLHLDLRAGTLRGRGHTRLHLPASAQVAVLGSSFSDVLEGTPRADDLLGLDGDDVLRGRGGDDSLQGNAGRNHLYGEQGDDLFVTAPDDGPGVTTALGGRGDDTFRLNPNDDVLAGPGHDHVQLDLALGATGVANGGSGRNTLVLSLAQVVDHVHVDLARGLIQVDGEERHISRNDFNRVLAEMSMSPWATGSWSIFGTHERDVIHAYSHAGLPAIIRGRGGDDDLLTVRGDDVLYGGPGTDRASAGQGNDVCTSIEGPLPGQPDTGCEQSSP